MVVEELLTGSIALRRPKYMLVYAIILATISMWSAFIIFPQHASVLTIAFISIGSVPVMLNAFLETEETDERIKNRVVIHPELVKMYMFFFIGLIIAFTAWYTIIPAQETNVCLLPGSCLNDISRDTFFHEQTQTLTQINQLRANLTGQVIANGSCGNDFMCWFNTIFVNNLEVLILTIFFSFMYGAGAIFLIAWNASVIAALIGESILIGLPWRFIGLLPHGIPELVSYFAAAIAGGLLSAAIVKGAIQRHAFLQILDEVLVFLLIGLISLIVGAVIETYSIIGEQFIAPILASVYLILLMGVILRIRKNEEVPRVISNRF